MSDEQTPPPATGEAAKPDPPAKTDPTVTPPAAPAGTGMVQLPEKDYRKLMEDRLIVEQHRQKEAEKAQKAEGERLRAVIEKEGLDTAVKQLREQQAETERKHQEVVSGYQRRLLDLHKKTQLGPLLLGVNWSSPDAAQDATVKIEAQFETVEVDGKPVTRQIGTGKSPAEAIPELLKLPAYGHFIAGGNAGGAGAAGTHKTGEVPSNDPKQRAREIIAKALEARNSDAIGLSGIGRMSAQN